MRSYLFPAILLLHAISSSADQASLSQPEESLSEPYELVEMSTNQLMDTTDCVVKVAGETEIRSHTKLQMCRRNYYACGAWVKAQSPRGIGVDDQSVVSVNIKCCKIDDWQLQYWTKPNLPDETELVFD